MSKKSILYLVGKPRHKPRWIVNILRGLCRRWRKKCSSLAEGGVQTHVFSNGVYLLILMVLLFGGVREGLSQPASNVEKGPEIRLGEVVVKIREFGSAPSPLKILEFQIEILNQSQRAVAPPDSIKVVVTPRASRVMIIGYPFRTENPESITFEVRINPPEGEKKTVTWENR